LSRLHHGVNTDPKAGSNLNLIDPTAVMALLVAVSLAALIGVALVAVLAAHEYAARRPTPSIPAGRPVRGSAGRLVSTH